MKFEILIEDKSTALAALENAGLKMDRLVKHLDKSNAVDLENATALVDAVYDWLYNCVHNDLDDELDEAEEESADRRGIDGNLK